MFWKIQILQLVVFTSRNMFHLYWPVAALVAAFVIVSTVLLLMLGGRLCGGRCARTDALPDRPLKTYLPESVGLNVHKLSKKSLII